MEDVNGHINEAALYLITTIPSAHNNDDVISDIQNYRKKQIESHNGMESKLTFACDNVIDILKESDNKKDWNISNGSNPFSLSEGLFFQAAYRRYQSPSGILRTRPRLKATARCDR